MAYHEIVVREATESDFSAIARIQEQCAEAAQWPLGDYSGFLVLVAEMEGLVCGFCCWRQVSQTEVELLNIGVDPAARRTGVGSALLEALRRLATGEIFLEVAENNGPAIALYTRCGWTPVGVRPAYYPGGIHAIVMKNRSW